MIPRRDLILDTISDLVADFLCYDRRSDEELPSGSIEAAIAAGEITPEEIAEQFRRDLRGELE